MSFASLGRTLVCSPPIVLLLALLVLQASNGSLMSMNNQIGNPLYPGRQRALHPGLLWLI